MKNLISHLSATATLVLGLTLFATAHSYAAGPFTVNTISDTHAVNGAVSALDASGHISIRSAVESANALGTATINIPANTYNLSLGEIDISPNGGRIITIIGAGAATTIINQDGNNRVLNIDVNSAGGSVATISGLTIQGGNDKVDNFGGAGILDGSIDSTPRDILTLSNCIVQNNHCRALTSSANGGGGVQMAGGDLNITGCTFLNNSSGSSPGAGVYFLPQNNTSLLSVTNSAFIKNSIADVTGAGIGGAAIFIDSTAATSTHTIIGCSFVSNSVSSTFNGGKVYGAVQVQESGANNFVNISSSSFVANTVTSANHVTGLGAALAVNSGKVTANFCRFFGNVADGGGSALFISVANASTVNAQNNWWGCNGGPGVGGCDSIIGDGASGAFGGSTVFTPWITLTFTPNPASINTGGSTTLTASFLQNSSATTLTAAQVVVLDSLPIAINNPQLGTLSSVQSTIQANGTATATFTAGGSPGTGHAMAALDNATVTANITINQPAVVTTNPSSTNVCSGVAATFTAAANGSPTPTVQWQVSTDGGGTFNPIAGANSTTLSFTTTAAQNGNQYRAVFTNAGGSATTTAATLTVNTAPSVTTNPVNQSVTAGQTANFTAAASGTPTPTVQWQISTDGGGTFNPIGGATSTRLSFTTTQTQNGNQFRAVFSTSCGTATTTAATLNVTPANVPPSITQNPATQAVCSGTTATFTAAASGTPTPTVQWQLSTDGGGTFNPIAGANSTTLSFTTTASENNNQYRAVFTNAGGSATTTAATLTVNTAPSVTTNPVSQSVTAGQTATFTAAATGTPTPTVQWQVSTDGGATFNPISAATSTTLSFATTQAQNGNQYRAVFSTLCGSATTTAATLTVTAANNSPVVTQNPASQSVCPGSTATFTAAATGTPTPSVQWQLSADGGGTFNPIAGANSTTLSFTATATQNGNQYRAVFTNPGGSATTTAAILTVNTPPVAGTDALGTTEGKSANAPVVKLLANDHSPAGGTLSIISVTSPSTTGGTVALNGAVVTYTPATGFFGSDFFTYTLSDTHCTAVGTVNVTVTSTNAPTLNTISITLTATGRVVLFAGIPNRTYVVQWSDNPTGPWTDFADGTTVASTTGLVQYTDSTSPIPPTRFYRTRVATITP